MKRKLLLTAAILFAACLSVILYLNSKPEVKDNKASGEAYKRVEYLKCNFYNEKDFRKSVTEASGTPLPGASVCGGITPHHLLAGSLISSFMKTVSAADPEVVVVLAPNHKGLGVNYVQTSSLDWQTPFGILKAAAEDAESLVNGGISGSNSALMQEDHSISGLVPYIKYYMPNARILPLLLNGNNSLDDSRRLGEAIQNKLKGKKYIVIASIDFSHYLTLDKADKMDEVTLKAINDRNLKEIDGMGNDNLDSPPTLISFLSAMTAEGADKSKLLAHSNSARIIKINPKETTSYFTMVFYR